MKQAVKRIIEAHQFGLITESDARNNLDCHNVRGSFRDDLSFVGYDYNRQEWIDTSKDDLVFGSQGIYSITK